MLRELGRIFHCWGERIGNANMSAYKKGTHRRGVANRLTFYGLVIPGFVIEDFVSRLETMAEKLCERLYHECRLYGDDEKPAFLHRFYFSTFNILKKAYGYQTDFYWEQHGIKRFPFQKHWYAEEGKVLPDATWHEDDMDSVLEILRNSALYYELLQFEDSERKEKNLNMTYEDTNQR